MILKQFYLECLAQASYLVIDEGTKTAAVIDPRRDVDLYIEEAERYGATIRHVLLTHFHADFIAGHVELRERTGARIYLGARADSEYDFRPLEDGDVLVLGDVQLRILETPGHTPESISIVVFDTNKDQDTPHAVLTGDTLFVGDVGRPDLMASVGVSAKELAGWLYDSLHEKLLKLPDETIVYPAHGAGSMCGKNLGTETSSTIGDQRRFNYALQPMDKETFISVVTANQPEAPAYFGYDAQMNKKERPTLDENLEKALAARTLEEVLELRKEGAQLVDVRDAVEFSGAHVAGSINIGLGGKFASWAGTLLDKETPIVIVADPGSEHEAIMRLGRIGMDDVAGYLEGGMQSLANHEQLVEGTERISSKALAQELDNASAPLVVDVRTVGEWESGHIEGSLNLPLARLVDRMDELPRDRDLVLMCRSGYRSMVGASLLLENGITRVRDVVGGMDGWNLSKLPTVADKAPSCGVNN